MSESGEPGSHATFTHSACRGVDARRAFALLLLGGSDMSRALALATARGAALSAPDMCDVWSSPALWRWQAVMAKAAILLVTISRNDDMRISDVCRARIALGLNMRRP